MRRRAAFPVAMLALVVGALAFRLPALQNRPFHGDEAVHAFKFLELWRHGVYRYDPNEFHGPTLYYAALPSVLIHGRRALSDCSESDFRLPIALFGAAMVLLISPLSSGLGRRAVLLASLLTALSPALVFYSRYFIQETLFAFFTLSVIVCTWQYMRSKRSGWLILAAIAAGLTIATKETAVLSFGAMVAALVLTRLWNRRVDSASSSPFVALPAGLSAHSQLLRRSSAVSRAPEGHLAEGPLAKTFTSSRMRMFEDTRAGLIASCVITALVVACLFISGFGTNHVGPLGVLTGPVDYLRSFTPWLQRARGVSAHIYPWHFYLDLLIWTHHGRGPVYSEALIVVLAVAGIVSALLPVSRTGFDGDRSLARFLAFFTICLLALYSAIPYKTPWCLISFLNGLILLAGIGVVAILRAIRSGPGRVVVAGALIAATIQLGMQSFRASFQAETDPANPYVYAQPVPDVVNLARWCSDVEQYSGAGQDMIVKVLWTDDYYWPIPWYMRRFNNVGYYHDAGDPTAALVLASPEFEDQLALKLDKTHVMARFFRIRPGVFAEAWVRMDVWEQYLKRRPRPVDTD